MNSPPDRLLALQEEQNQRPSTSGVQEALITLASFQLLEFLIRAD